jgi:hypothetical protein
VPDSRPSINPGIPSSDALAEADETPSWESLTAENGPTTPLTDARTRAARKGPGSSAKRLGGLAPAIAPNRHIWVVGIVSSIVLALVLVIALLAWLFGSKPDKKQAVPREPILLRVNRLGSDGAHSSISLALKSLSPRSRQPARIVLEEDIAESDVLVTLPNVTIEAETGKKITWRCPKNAKPGSKILMVSKAPGFRLKNVTLDGEDRIETLVNLSHHCPALILEDLILRGFQKYAIWITNCEGGEDFNQHVLIQRDQFVSTKPEQTDIFFSIEKLWQDVIPVNKFFIVRDCTWGQGVKVKASDLKALERYDLPTGIQAVQGK